MLRLLLFWLFILAIDVYAFQALRVWAQSLSDAGRAVAYGLFGLLTLGGYFYLIMMQLDLTDNWPRSITTPLRALVFISYFSRIMIVAVLLIDDLRRLFSWVYQALAKPATPLDMSRSRFLARLALILGSIPLATLTYGMVRNPYRYRTFSEKVPIANLPEALEGLRIVQISDIHSGSFTRSEPLREAVEMVHRADPDLVFFTGDIVNNRAEEMEPYVDIFGQINARHGVYSVLGNHDYGDYVRWDSEEAKRANMEQLESVHRRMGWQLLRNENRVLDIRGEKLAVIGVENWSALARFPKYGDLDKAVRGTEPAPVKLLLSHDPTHWEAEVQPRFPDIDLMFSGHTHGMQFGIEIPGFRWSPASFVYKQWAGLYRAGKQSLYVNRGLGFLGYPGRVGILPEITVLTLTRA